MFQKETFIYGRNLLLVRSLFSADIDRGGLVISYLESRSLCSLTSYMLSVSFRLQPITILTTFRCFESLPNKYWKANSSIMVTWSKKRSFHFAAFCWPIRNNCTCEHYNLISISLRFLLVHFLIKLNAKRLRFQSDNSHKLNLGAKKLDQSKWSYLPLAGAASGSSASAGVLTNQWFSIVFFLGAIKLQKSCRDQSDTPGIYSGF